MSPAAKHLATLAASLGRRFTVRDLADMSGTAVSELVEPIQELIDADIFKESDDRLAFGHDLIREGAAASSPTAVRRALDRQAVDVLIARGALPVEVAVQLVDSAEVGDYTAIAILLQAADDLGVTDPGMAAELATRALDLAPDGHLLRGPLVAARVTSLFAAGLGEEGKRFADSALRSALAPKEEARVRLSVASMFDLSPEIRADNARAALALPDLDTDVRASLWASLFHNLVVGGRLEDALAIEPKAREAVYASANKASWFAFELPPLCIIRCPISGERSSSSPPPNVGDLTVTMTPANDWPTTSEPGSLPPSTASRKPSKPLTKALLPLSGIVRTGHCASSKQAAAGSTSKWAISRRQ